jgi:hypothetical protein
MTWELIFGIVGIAGLIVSVCAIIDVRAQVMRLIRLERNRAYSRVANDTAWLFLTSNDSSHSKEVLKGLEEFFLLAEEAKPGWVTEATYDAVTNQSLEIANDYVDRGIAKWGEDWDAEKVKEELRAWRAAKNQVRVSKMYRKPPTIF